MEDSHGIDQAVPEEQAHLQGEVPLEADEVGEATEVYLVGEFNDWDAQATPMRRLKDGAFTAEVELETGREYRFRYLLVGGATGWLNDGRADSYEYCPFAGTDNSLVSV